MPRKKSITDLRNVLDDLYESYLADYRRSPSEFFVNRQDPLAFAHRYSTFHDMEAAGFLAATFAYGRVQSLCAFVNRLLSELQPSPYQFLKRGPQHVNTLRNRKLYYRLQDSEQILGILRMLAKIYEQLGSLYEVYRLSYYNNSTIESTTTHFVRALYSIHGAPLPFLLPSPESGSPCKRLNLFLRWMIRTDGIDLGLWKEISTARLIIPLDTHIGRVAYRMRWIDTPSLSWRKAEKITDVLRQFHAEDPVRYDFSLCHESIERGAWFRNLVG